MPPSYHGGCGLLKFFGPLVSRGWPSPLLRYGSSFYFRGAGMTRRLLSSEIHKTGGMRHTVGAKSVRCRVTPGSVSKLVELRLRLPASPCVCPLCLSPPGSANCALTAYSAPLLAGCCFRAASALVCGWVCCLPVAPTKVWAPRVNVVPHRAARWARH